MEEIDKIEKEVFNLCCTHDVGYKIEYPTNTLGYIITLFKPSADKTFYQAILVENYKPDLIEEMVYEAIDILKSNSKKYLNDKLESFVNLLK